MRLRYNPARGWFHVLEFLCGSVTLTGINLPDQYGCFCRRYLTGPYPTAKEASTAWTS